MSIEDKNNPSEFDFKTKKDSYRRSRGGNSFLLDICCANCHERLMIYQKDGPGTLVRVYIDRILWPQALLEICNQAQSKKDLPNLQCTKCNTIIATAMVYEKENRLAYRMKPGAFTKAKIMHRSTQHKKKK